MKIDVNYQFKNIRGKIQRESEIERDKNELPIRDKFGNLIPKLGPKFTLRSACLNVLVDPPQEINERTGRPVEMSAEHNLMLAELARDIYKSTGLVELSTDDVTLIKDYINKKYNNSPLIVNQAFEVLDPTDAQKKKKKKKKE